LTALGIALGAAVLDLAPGVSFAICFVVGPGHGYEDGKPTGTTVYVIDADGSNERRLTDPAMFAGEADWSLDGEWIVFDIVPLNEFRCCQVSNLYRVRPDGSGMEQITFNESEELRATQPLYTPDGE
jgi:Tol biopolymer transport system component